MVNRRPVELRFQTVFGRFFDFDLPITKCAVRAKRKHR